MTSNFWRLLLNWAQDLKKLVLGLKEGLVECATVCVKSVVILTVLAPGTCKVYKKAKFLSFHDNQRPAYFGTWSKKSSKVSARLPFGKDTDLFDYDYDSDDDWEEEEQGESIIYSIILIFHLLSDNDIY